MVVSTATAAQQAIQEAYPKAKYGSVKQALWAAYLKMTRVYSKDYPELKGWTLRRAETLWQGAARRVDWYEMAALQHEIQRGLANEQRTNFRRTAEHLLRLDPVAYRDTIAALVGAAFPHGIDDFPNDQE